MKVAAYLRVSTDRQAEHGLGLDVQRDAIRTWARANKHRVVVWAADEGVSGSNGLDDRQALPDVLEALKDGTAAGLVVYRLDRLARDLILQESILADLRRAEIPVFSTSLGEAAYLTDDPDDPSRKLIRQILGAVNEYERSMISLRLRSGRRRKAERGGFAYGAPPYGWEARNGELVPRADEQAALARIRVLNGAGASTRDIASALEAEGYRPRRGERWHSRTISRILLREEAKADD